ncbi:MAG: thiol:disulfide interchange protein [Flavobacteriales bacterium]|nr:thiol:disulfide interchange protein [Flavobacteriales bacterium]
MTKNKFFFLVLFISQSLFSQIFDPVKWTFKIDSINQNEVEFVANATIDDGWYTYSQFLPEGGPVPTSFSFNKSQDYDLIGEVIEDSLDQKYDPNFRMNLKLFKKSTSFRQRIKLNKYSESKLKGYLEFMACNDVMCLPPEYVDFELVIPKKIVSNEIKTNNPILNETNIFNIFLVAFFSGFIALLTPCVFPMIPLTVSFFTKQSSNKIIGIRNAIIYGLSIVIIYVFLGVAVTGVFGSDILNNMATNVYFNLVFFIVLIVFAASFLGAFELTLPNSWINKSDSLSEKGGLIGIFFMAFTLALVSFSCTGPIVGTILVQAAYGGSYLAPIFGMLGFSSAIAIPFALFAAFPGWMNSLPKSGNWLNSVKVTLGFIELALAFKFLSNADIVLQLNLLNRELFISIWIFIFLSLTLYLLGILNFKGDSDLKIISVPRLFLAIIFGSFTIYMIPGLWGAPLKLINAFPPPIHYSESPLGFHTNMNMKNENISIKNNDLHLGPQGIMVYHDYQKGLNFAKKVNKPIMLDFTGWACVNCRKMEEKVWSDIEVKSILQNDLVLISLYVDERTKLEVSDQYDTEIAGKRKKVRTVGDKWMVMQTKLFKTNSQPYYVFLDHSEKKLIEPANYQDYGNVNLFKDWLKRGLLAFNSSDEK